MSTKERYNEEIKSFITGKINDNWKNMAIAEALQRQFPDRFAPLRINVLSNTVAKYKRKIGINERPRTASWVERNIAKPTPTLTPLELCNRLYDLLLPVPKKERAQLLIIVDRMLEKK
jgi:hypothetical protein